MPRESMCFTSFVLLTGSFMVLACAGAALADDRGPCAVQGSCGMSFTEPMGLAWDGSHLWVGYGVMNGQIQRIDPSDCSAVGSIASPGSYVNGLAWDGSSLWATVESFGFIYEIDPASGAILSQIPAPSAEGSHGSAGLAWDGTHLWHADYRLRSLYRIDPADGTILDTFYLDLYVSGVGYRASDGMLIVSDFGNHKICTIDPADGTVVTSCDSPATRAWGVALAGDEVRVLEADEELLYDLGLLTEVSNERWSWGQIRKAYR